MNILVYMVEFKLLHFVTKLTSKRQKNLSLSQNEITFSLIGYYEWKFCSVLILRNYFLVEMFLDWLLAIHFQPDVVKTVWGLVGAFPVNTSENHCISWLTILFVEQAVSGDFRFCFWSITAILKIDWDDGREIFPILIYGFHSSFRISQHYSPFFYPRTHHGFLQALVLSCLKP